MKLAFSTSPIEQSETQSTALLNITKAIKAHEGVHVTLRWTRDDEDAEAGWDDTGLMVDITDARDMKAAANIITSLDKAMDELKLWGVTPLQFMRAMEKGGKDTPPAVHVVIHGGEQLGADDLSKVSDQWRPVGFDGVQVNGVDEADGKSSIKGRMIKLLSDADKAAAVGKWFAEGQQVEKVPGSDKPTFVPQSAYK